MSGLRTLFHPYHGTRVLVVGASGFIGRWVARKLGAVGADVHLAVRSPRTSEPVFSRYEIHGVIHEVDLSKPVETRNVVRQIEPAIIFNLAGYGVDRAEVDEPTAYAINALLPGVLCEGIAEAGNSTWSAQRIVHVGSALEYGTVDGHLVENSPTSPTTLYGMSKLAGTRILACCCDAMGIRGLTARLFTVYGPGEHDGRLLPSILRTRYTGEPLPLTSGIQKRDFTYVEDVAEGLLRLGLTREGPGEVVNLATGRLTPVREFALTAATVLALPLDRLHFGQIPIRAEEMRHSEVAVDKLRSLTDWAPSTGIVEGIRKTLEFDGMADRRERAT